MPILSLPSFTSGLTSGFPNKIATGTGASKPGGVESVFEFNGILMNVRGWYDTYVITSISGVGDPDVRDSRDVNPGRDGETYFNAYYGGRTIVLTGYIRAYSLNKLRDMQQGLKKVFGNLAQEQPLYIRTGSATRDVFIYCKKSAPLVMDEAQVGFEYRRDFQITLRASNPRFLSYLEERISYASGWADLAAPGPAPPVSDTNLVPNGRANPPGAGGVTPGVAGWAFITTAAPGIAITSALAQAPISNSNFSVGRAFNIQGTTPSSFPMTGTEPPFGGPNLAMDTFDQTAGALTGKTLAFGGTWSGAGSAVDYVVDATTHTAQRPATTSADTSTGLHFGRFAIADTSTYSNVVVQVDTKWATVFSGSAGVFARYIDTNNFLAVTLAVNSLTANRCELVVTRRVAGVSTEMARVEHGVINNDVMTSVRLAVDAAGNVQADSFTPGSAAGTPLITTSHASLATGGALASGKVGFINWGFGPTLPVRTYDNFGAWTPEGVDGSLSPPYAFFEHSFPSAGIIPAVAGESYRWTVSLVPTSHAIASAGPVTYYMYLSFVTPSGSTNFSTSNLLSNVGGRISTTGIAPTGTTNVRLLIGVPLSSSKSFNLNIGDSVLTRFSENNFGEYFDGESANGLWNGTRYLSTSRRYPATGLEGLYLPEASSEAGWYLDTDGWMKHLGGNPSAPTVRQIYRSDQTRTFTDLQATVKIGTDSNVTSTGTFGLVMKRKTGADFLYLRLLASGGTSRLQINKFNSGVETQLAQSATLLLTPNTTYWLRGRVAGNTVVLELWTTHPDGPGPFYATITHTLIGTDSTDFGSGVVGGFGLRSTLSENGMTWGWRDHDTDQIALSPTLAFNAANNGNAPAQPMLKVYGPLSAATSGGNAVRVAIPRVLLDGSSLPQQMIINAKTGSTLAIPSGNYIEVDSDKRTLKEYTSLGVFVRNSFDQLDLASDWMELDPGDNPVEVQNYAVGTSPTLEMRYRHTFF